MGAIGFPHEIKGNFSNVIAQSAKTVCDLDASFMQDSGAGLPIHLSVQRERRT